MNNLQNILVKIKRLEDELRIEIQKKEEEFFYTVKGRKVRFDAETRKLHKRLAMHIHTYLLNASFLNILTAPVIWSCIFPAVFMDLILTAYQFICFPVYGIPKVKRTDYIILDRHNLSYLNPIEKFNCIYCGYFNGLIAYVQEISSRTEQYWCPIKHARKMKTFHRRYHKFLEYGDHRDYQDRFRKLRHDFKDLDNNS